ncbi:MAG: 30S ribosome-binding factor RbfA [Candidatus Hydrogenedentota bacterium]
MNEIRLKKIESLFQQEINNILYNDLKKKIGIFSIIEVALTNDLSLAKVYISFINLEKEDEEKQISYLNESSGEIRYILKKRLRLKKIPELVFALDHRIRDGMRIISIMDRWKKDDRR